MRTVALGPCLFILVPALRPWLVSLRPGQGLLLWLTSRPYGHCPSQQAPGSRHQCPAVRRWLGKVKPQNLPLSLLLACQLDAAWLQAGVRHSERVLFSEVHAGSRGCATFYSLRFTYSMPNTERDIGTCLKEPCSPLLSSSTIPQTGKGQVFLLPSCVIVSSFYSSGKHSGLSALVESAYILSGSGIFMHQCHLVLVLNDLKQGGGIFRE